MLGRKEFKSDLPPLKNEEYADQLKTIEQYKSVEKKDYFNFYTNLVFGL